MFDPIIPLQGAKAEEILEIRKRFGFHRFFIVAPGAGRSVLGSKNDLALFEEIAIELNQLRKEVNDPDIELNWWFAPSIGSATGLPFQHIVNHDGRVSTNAACPFDPDFRKDFAEKVARTAELSHPKIIHFEDDFRLMWHNPNIDFGCFCPLHLKAMEEATGRKWTREEVVEMYNEDKRETQELRRIYSGLMKESLCGLAGAVREAVDKVAPETRLSVCEPGATEMEGSYAFEEARRFAGSNTKPLMRLYGSEYSSFTNPTRIPETLSHTMYSAEHIPPDYEWMHESDTYPHTRFFMSASRLEALIAESMAFGADNSQLYATQYLDDPLEDDAYFKMAKKNAGRFEAIGKASRNGTFDGCHLQFDPASVYLKALSANKDSNSYISGFSMLSRLGIPFSTVNGSPEILIGQQADVLSDAELERILSTAVLMDSEAAELIEKRGFGSLLGVKTERIEKINFSKEIIADIPEFAHIKGRRIYIFAFQPAGSESAQYLNLIPLPGAEVLSTYTNEYVANIQPGMVRFVNEKGGRICITACAISRNDTSNIFCYRKREMLRIVINWLRGSKMLPAAVLKEPNVWLLVRRTPEYTLFDIMNLNMDILEGLVLAVAPEFRTEDFEELDSDGKWQPILVKNDGEKLMIPGRFIPMRLHVFRIKN